MSASEANQLAKFIDHTLLKADAGESHIRRLCAEAIEHQFFSVCVHSEWVPRCHELLTFELANQFPPHGVAPKIAAVCGFPFGANATRVKVFEAQHAVNRGAHEIDMVLQIGKLLAGDYAAVEQDIRAVVEVVQQATGGPSQSGAADPSAGIVKVILETGYLNDEQKRIACELSVAAGAHFVKTSTGFGPGGATVDDIRLMRAAVGPTIGVKASGGVRDTETARAMIAAGATRIGTSSGIAIVAGFASTTDPSQNY